jgi:aerobic-type carbon monoxide dehydrogenase small subunit (CoxS/CutS family)
MATLNVNGVRREVQAPDDTPLLYVLRNDLELIGPQFGCGLAQCGACAVLVDGKETRSCVTPVASVANQEITTLEGLPARWAIRCSKRGSRSRLRSAAFARTE